MSKDLEDPGDNLQQDVQPAAPMQENGDRSGWVICARCSTANPVGSGTCAACRSFLPANQAARRTGIYARQQPPDLRLTADELMNGILSDLGGESELSTLQTAYVRKLADVEITIRLLTSDIAANGLLTPGGRVRDVYDKLLAGLGVFDRYAQRIGLERRAKRVPSLAEVLSGE
ncbi:MAG: hypothetical protein Q7J25_10700 [Vicinamibacterales bacterium]|nr:hypothetical protein [Vicinamibacterales bacterium]